MSKALLSKIRENAPQVQLFLPQGDERNTSFWKINGYPARVIVWSVEEWERLPERPPDAQFIPCGVWCVLKID